MSQILTIALAKGRILAETLPLLKRAGIAVEIDCPPLVVEADPPVADWRSHLGKTAQNALREGLKIYERKYSRATQLKIYQLIWR